MGKKIFIFNIGMDDKANDLKRKLEIMGFDVHLGPTKEDDEYLEKNSSYYRRVKKEKIYPFMADVYRYWKLSSEGGIYLDISLDIKVNNETKKMLNDMTKYQFFGYKSNNIKVENAVIAGKKGNYVTTSALSYLEILSSAPSKEIRNTPPVNILTMLFFLEEPTIDFNDFNNDRWHLESFKKIRDKNTIYKSGLGSWKKSNSEFDWWSNQERLWNKRVSTLDHEKKEFRKITKALNKALKNKNKNIIK